MKVLIVLAHHEPTSFTSALAQHGVSALRDAGHQVEFSDLYAMSFDPVSDRRNFAAVANPDRLDQQFEERAAAESTGFAPELQAEMDKLARCDLLVLQFPIWWLGMPAIMKGWIDRVFAIGRTYGGGRWFDQGMMAGKQAMLAVTVGGTHGAYSDQGIYGPIDAVLEPIHHGILAFCGFSVLPPFLAFAPARKTPAERETFFKTYADRLLNVSATDHLPMLLSDDYQNFIRKAAKVEVRPF